MFALPPLKRYAYELFLRIHHILAAAYVYAIWRHVVSKRLLPMLYLYASVSLLSSMCIVQLGTIIHRNGLLQHKPARAKILCDSGVVKVCIECSKPLSVKAGQYIDVWLPSIGSTSFLQTHPFVVASWAKRPQKKLELLVEPRRGLTRELLSYAKETSRTKDALVLFSGPHGKHVPLIQGENVLLVASDFGITAHLPYLKQLIRSYNTHESRVKRIHLVWQVQNIGRFCRLVCMCVSRELMCLEIATGIQPILNKALDEDRLNDGYVCVKTDEACLLSLTVRCRT